MKDIQIVKRSLYIIVGTFLMAAALNVFIEPCSLVTGGASGLAVIVKDIGQKRLSLDIPLWVTTMFSGHCNGRMCQMSPHPP